MIRKPHWEESLSIYIANAKEARFEWGLNDCAHFACGAVEAITGEKLIDFTGQYSSMRESAMWLKERGYRSFKDAATDKFGTPTHPSKAGRGDIVMRRVGNGNALGVCVGKHAWFLGEEIVKYDEHGEAITEPALISWPTLLCDVAWRI